MNFCAVCASGKSTDLGVGSADGQLVRCEGCGTVRLSSVGTSIQSLNVRDYSGDRHDLVFPPDLNQRFTRWADFRLDQLLRVKPDIQSMAEVGSGTGHFLRVAMARGIDVKGIDLVDHRNCGREAAFECAQDPFSSLGASQWDAVAAFHVLEHCSDPLGAVRSVLASLGKGGIAFVEVPGILEETPPIPCMIDPRHQWYFSEKTLRHLVGKAGGKVVSVERVGPTQGELESAATAGRRMTSAWSWLKGILPAKCLDLARGLLRPQRERGMRLMSGFTGSHKHSDVPLNLCIFFERMA